MNDLNNIKIESRDLSVGDLFKDFFSVPDFQREYVWQQEQVERLLQDVYDEFYDEAGNIIPGAEYFLGSVVACQAPDGTYQLIDGQQRMTTLYLVLCAIRDALDRICKKQNKVLNAMISDAAIDPRTFEVVERYRITLQYEDSEGVLERIAAGACPVDDIPDTTASVRNIKSAYQSVSIFLHDFLDTDGQRLRQFHGVLTTRVKLIRIVTPTIANALKVFETINDRGVGLNAMDLLKNMLFMKVESKDYPKLKDRWKTLVDRLDSCKEKPLRFLRYFIMAHHEIDSRRGIREDEIHEWFTRNSNRCGIDSDPLGFVDRLIECAAAHANFLSQRDAWGEWNQHLYDLSLLGGALRQQFILLMAGRKLPPDLFGPLCEAIEKLLFCYIITREPTKTLERNFARWARQLRDVKSAQHLKSFVETNFVQDMNSRRDRFELAFRELAQDRIQQYRMRYILAKLTEHIDRRAYGDKGTGLKQYIAKTVHVEHILPQTPSQKQRSEFDKRDEYGEYAIKLGNLALLEEPHNISASNKEYAEKRDYYSQSNFLLTESLVERPHVGQNSRLNRAVEGLIQFYEWDSRAIENRQKMLTRLAFEVWGMESKCTESRE
ncbi:DUF262 domain-containing protein [bacterium]|nr:DUF262 domain-containing protein [bacterium]